MAEGKKARVAKLYISPLPFWNECHYSASRKAIKIYFIIVLNLIRRINLVSSDDFLSFSIQIKKADYKLS